MLNQITKMDSRFLIKQIKLHINIALEYWELVAEETWKLLYNKICEKRFLIQYVITLAEKKKIESDLEDFETFRKLLKDKLQTQLKIVA